MRLLIPQLKNKGFTAQDMNFFSGAVGQEHVGQHWYIVSCSYLEAALKGENNYLYSIQEKYRYRG